MYGMKQVEMHEFHGNALKLWADPKNRIQQGEKKTVCNGARRIMTYLL